MSDPLSRNDAINSASLPQSGGGSIKILLALGLAGAVILAGILTDSFSGSSHRSLPRLASVRSKPSFDCSTAYEWVERAVCSDLALAALDNKNADLYQQRFSDMDPQSRRDLAKAEEKWVAERNACESESDPLGCIAQAYQKRISELSGSP